MTKQNVFIINYSSLYEILEEIKENLSFKIIKYENNGTFIKALYLDMTNSLIISKSNQKILLNKEVKQKNLLNFDFFPLHIKKLLELISIKLMKLRFNYQSKINIKGYELNLNSKFFSKNDLILKLTEKEIEIILYLSEIKTKHDVLDLVKNKLDITFANEQEIKSLTSAKNFEDIIAFGKQLGKLLVITRGEKGSIAIQNNEVIECGSKSNLKILDLTGAGDLFASGFLHGFINNFSIKNSLEKGTEMSSKIIQKVGARLN